VHVSSCLDPVAPKLPPAIDIELRTESRYSKFKSLHDTYLVASVHDIDSYCTCARD
jgi:hypothetical protein